MKKVAILVLLISMVAICPLSMAVYSPLHEADALNLTMSNDGTGFWGIVAGLKYGFILLYESNEHQNELMERQNALIEEQNRLVENQTALISSMRRCDRNGHCWLFSSTVG